MDAKRLVARAVIVVIGAVAAALVWVIAGVAGRIQVPLGGASSDMPLWQVLTAAVVVGLAGWGLLAGLERRIPPRAGRIWTTVAVLVAAVSLAGPLGMPGIEIGDRLWLVAMHVALAVAYIPAMSATTSARTATIRV